MDRTPDLELDANTIRQAVEENELPDFDGDDPALDKLADVLAEVSVLAQTQDVWILVRKLEPDEG